MTAALDTNVLAYAEGANDAVRQTKAIELLGVLPAGRVVIPVQVLGELFRVLTRKAGRSHAEARAAVLAWRGAATVCDTTTAALLSAMDLSADHGLSIWDALILSVAAEASCRVLISEDLQEGFVWRGVTVVDPFAEHRHPILASMIAPA